MMTTTVAATKRPDCDYCPEPSSARRIRLERGNPASRRVALDHDGCYRRFMGELSARVRAAS